MKKSRVGWLLGAWGLLAGVLCFSGRAATAQAAPSQVQVARRFLLAVVGGEWETAYGWLAPEVRQHLSKQQFQVALQPFQAQAGRYGKAISLYKLGYRLRGSETPEPFVGFSFRADTLGPRPRFQLDVTFRDSTARQVQGFGLIPLSGPVK
ncbi:hypothetical protein K3G63_12090 [Hymenobacter sp. HSC-4F20]|uniref:hypothetical protein n=1 Tax=Hymenobacter sp. HSC-4F20 TaxID=2864135 RepID=UPI001C72E1A7|nr:hypothetical protein [Hymenobacter sp. HSC-4F20]MBX0291187.1 hypothetical protein [Hymenobacter sp. HSC-4F20]